MSVVVTETDQDTASGDGRTIVNDMVIKIATTNGSGSQSANLILMRSIFRMGVPVSGKNLFPSNIAGLPTWFTIRANASGWQAQRSKIDIFVAMNRDTLEDDLSELEPGGIVVLNDSLKHQVNRDDLTIYPVPFSKIVKEACSETRFRKKVVNVIYVGVLASLLNIDMDNIEEAISHQFGGKARAVELNLGAAATGYRWAQENLTDPIPFTFKKSDLTKDKIIIEGNQAAALGFLFGVVQDLLGLFAERNLDGCGEFLPGWSAALQFGPQQLHRYVGAGEQLSYGFLALFQQAQQQMLRADDFAPLLAGFVARQEEDALGFLGELLEH